MPVPKDDPDQSEAKRHFHFIYTCKKTQDELVDSDDEEAVKEFNAKKEEEEKKREERKGEEARWEQKRRGEERKKSLGLLPLGLETTATSMIQFNCLFFLTPLARG